MFFMGVYLLFQSAVVATKRECVLHRASWDELRMRQ